jgi:hypothetical protein
MAVNHEFDLGCLKINLIDQFEGHDAQYEYCGMRLHILVGVLDDRR